MKPSVPAIRQLLLEAFQAALLAVNGRARVHAHLSEHVPTSPVYLVAVGKAACSMALGAHDALGERIAAALIVTKYGHAERLPWPVHEAGHPRPDAHSLEAGEALVRFASSCPADAHVLVLLSGGASALVERLPAGLDLEHLQRINDWLVGSGLDIHHINRIRKRLSLIKGGRLAALFFPRTVTCLAISDVPGDDPGTIGSGPLVADASFSVPIDVPLPDFVRTVLDKTSPPPRAKDACFDRVSTTIIARLDDAKRAAAVAVERFGCEARVMPRFIEGDAANVGSVLARELLDSEPDVVYVWGGETTVRLPPQSGRGGRNQAIALAAALALEDRDGACFLAAGTDGTDGPTQDAGALVDGETIARGLLHGLDARTALVRADAGTFLDASGDLIHTGPTGTNVMDLMLGFRCKR